MRALEYLLNFRTNRAALGSANQDVKSLRDNILGVGTSIGKIQGDLTKFAKSQKWANITTLSKSAIGGIAGVGRAVSRAFSESFELVQQMATEGDRVAKTARLVGMSVKDYQAFSFAAERSGLSLAEFDSGLQRFSVNLGKARSGDKTAASMFESILPGNLADYKSEREIILAISDSYAQLSESQRNFVSQSIFGRSGLKFGNLFGAGADEVEKLLDQYEKHGGGFSEEGAKNAENFVDDLTNMNVTMKSFRILLTEGLIPAFSELFQSTTKFFVENKAAIKETVKGLGVTLVKSIKEIVPKIPALVTGSTKILGIIASIVEFLGPIKTIVGVGLIASLGSIVTLVTSLIGLIGGPAVAAIGACVAGVAAWASTFKTIYDNWDLLVSFIVDDIIPAIRDGFFGFFDWLSNGLEQSVLKGFNNGFRNAVRAIPGVGKLLFSDVDFSEADSGQDIGGDFAALMQSQQQKTVNSKFVVDFKNVPKGVQITPPKEGDFDYSYGRVLGGM